MTFSVRVYRWPVVAKHYSIKIKTVYSGDDHVLRYEEKCIVIVIP